MDASKSPFTANDVVWGFGVSRARKGFEADVVDTHPRHSTHGYRCSARMVSKESRSAAGFQLYTRT